MHDPAGPLKRPNSLYMFHFDIVHGCQLRCVGCPNSTLLPKVQRISIPDFERCMGNVDVEHVRTLRLFNFGEPLLHKNISGIFEVLRRQPWQAEHVEISTNGQLCYWDDFAEALKLGVLNRLVVSCDGDGTPAHYEELRPPSKWENLIEFLERIKDLRDRYSPQLELMTRTIIETDEAIRRWRSVLEPRGWQPEFRDWKHLPESEKNMTGRATEPGEGVCTFMAPTESFRQRYYGELNQLYVDCDGTVVPCCAHPKAADLGSLKQETVSELLVNQRRQHFRWLLENDRQNVPICNACEFGPPQKPGKSFPRLNRPHEETAVEDSPSA